MKRADMIISHCGAGSVLEAISLRKFLIVVVNSTLQGNHQTELADAGRQEVLPQHGAQHAYKRVRRDR